MLTKTIFKFNESMSIGCLNRNSLQLQIVFIVLTQMGRGIQKRSLILIPVVINLSHTIYLNSLIKLAFKDQEILEHTQLREFLEQIY